MALPTLNRATVKQWGNSLALRLPAEIAKVAGVAEDSAVIITAERGRVVIEVPQKRMTLEERLAKFDPKRHGGELLDVPMGREIL